MRASTAFESDREKVELCFSCRKLKNMDILSKTDAQLVIYSSIQDKRGPSRETCLGKTEIVFDSLNPDFAKSFEMDFIFERKQIIRIEVRDIDDGKGDHYERMGEVSFELGELLGSISSMLTKELTIGPKKFGHVVIRADRVAKENHQHKFLLACSELKGFGMCGSIKPFLRIVKPQMTPKLRKLLELDQVAPDDYNSFAWVKVYESEHHTNPSFTLRPFEIKSSKLCNSMKNVPFKIQLWSYRSNGSHSYKAECMVTLNALEKGQKVFELRRAGGGSWGQVRFVEHKQRICYSFLEYLNGGLQIKLITSIDFTGSNGVPRMPSSLHYNNPMQRNQYQKAIEAVGEILLNYDHDKKVPVYGFGAKTRFPGHGKSIQTNHFFPCSGDMQNCAGEGVPGIFRLYNYALSNVELSGPTYFAPTIKEVVQFTKAKESRNPYNYTVLLILTDGCIHDMGETIHSIVGASTLPLSIIIIGVGDENFDKMEALDSDDTLLRDPFTGKTAKRDIVQFVEFKRYANYPAELAAQVLEELPRQVTNHYSYRRLNPKTAPTKDEMKGVFGGLGGIMGVKKPGAGQRLPPVGLPLKNSKGGGQATLGADTSHQTEDLSGPPPLPYEVKPKSGRGAGPGLGIAGLLNNQHAHYNSTGPDPNAGVHGAPPGPGQGPHQPNGGHVSGNHVTMF